MTSAIRKLLEKLARVASRRASKQGGKKTSKKAGKGSAKKKAAGAAAAGAGAVGAYGLSQTEAGKKFGKDLNKGLDDFKKNLDELFGGFNKVFDALTDWRVIGAIVLILISVMSK